MHDESPSPPPLPQGVPGEFESASLTDEPTGSLDRDLPCRHCGYNLRGMTEYGTCPECGTEVGRSLLSDQLCFSDPAWVGTLASGAAWIVWGELLGLVVSVCSFVFGVMLFVPPWLDLVNLVPALVALVGNWLITSGEPGAGHHSDLSLRLFVRWTTVGGIVISMPSVMMAYTWPLMSQWLGMAGVAVSLVASVGLCVYVRRLALRVPDYALAKQTRIVMWGFLSVIGGGVLSFILGIGLVMFSPNSGAVGFVLLPVCAFGVAYLVFVVWGIVLTFWYRRVISAVARHAQENWANDVGIREVYRGGQRIARSRS